MANAPLLNPIRIRLVEHVPFPLWDAEDFLGDDFTQLSEWLGLSRPTYEALASLQATYEALGSTNTLPDDLITQRELARAALVADLQGSYEVVVE
ncbi:hypothetical protein [Nocardioides sp.]|uniref:hypothetical protein n=1 Tax=Nocardioides sp. TaxID=35761 RepID=UPI002C7A166B|nr:hypothetical protein [Nocardioides sp.]HSX66282.1 hypothetical protein [Nocardioides sp.]